MLSLGEQPSPVRSVRKKGSAKVQEHELALPILKKYYQAKMLRQKQLEPMPSPFRSKLPSLTTSPHARSLEFSSVSSPKLGCVDAEKALAKLIEECDTSSPTSVKQLAKMHQIEVKVRRDLDKMKAFFKKDKKATYSERRKYWVDEPVMTHAKVKSMLKSLRINSKKTKVFV
jgi:hypothetical protein